VTEASLIFHDLVYPEPGMPCLNIPWHRSIVLVMHSALECSFKGFYFPRAVDVIPDSHDAREHRPQSDGAGRFQRHCGHVEFSQAPEVLQATNLPHQCGNVRGP